MEQDRFEKHDRVERRLAAILHADVVGYSRLMEQDEVGTHRVLVKALDAISALIEKHGGKAVNFAGDAVLAEFASAVDAIVCAIEVQRAAINWNADLDEERRFRFRIGLNLGDVIVSRDDLYGDGVNVAARLQALADAGGICISGTIFDQVRTKLEIGYEYCGEQQVKNIAGRVRMYRVIFNPETAGMVVGEVKPRRRWQAAVLAVALVATVGTAAAIYWYALPYNTKILRDQANRPRLPAKPSIAVLPFKNIGGDASQNYFSDGITEDIITDLSKFRDLFVIASNTVFTYKGKPVNVQDVSRQLGVRYVLEGSVQRAGEKIRVNAQLIDATRGHHVWADRLVRDMKDLFALQDEIVRTIVSTMAAKIDVAERELVMRKKTSNLAAYDFLLRGREHLSRSRSSDNDTARKLFRRAIELDPRFGAAYVALGQCYLDALRYGWSASPSTALQQAHDLAQKALALDQRNAGARRLLGYTYLKRNKYDLATKEFERALVINPNDAESHDALGSAWLYTGRTDAAIASVEIARRFNPNLQASGLIHLGLAYYLKGRYDDAIRTLEPTLGRNPNLVFLHIALAAAYAQAGRMDDAARAATNVRRRSPFFKVDLFGNGFSNPADRANIHDGLRKAGLN